MSIYILPNFRVSNNKETIIIFNYDLMNRWNSDVDARDWGDRWKIEMVETHHK